MRCKTAMVAILLVVLSANAYAKSDFGVGVIVGEPTGLSLKYWLDDEHAIDAAAAWSFSDNDSFQVHADYLWHRFDIFDTGELTGKTPLYYGIGARLKDKDKHDHTVFGIRIPLGITYMFADAPFDLFAEIVPIVDLAPDVDVDINAAIGFRFYFK